MKSATHFWFDSRHESLIMANLHSFTFGDRISFSAVRKDGKSNILLERHTNPEKPVDESQITRVEFYLYGYVTALNNMTKHFQALSALSEPVEEPAVV